ncbi:flagella basal body P-ring formation protein FlgA [Sphingomonas sp.]|uniref:flagella basal body P-ring formation protein FlgA n=1 Tax=Sphingomonas sp. TaxID=28214 RepID=UPI001B0F71E7|nr:flagella basal body P-ring formation protein FlgA [Sphingomonas sp.]MBO9714791.1 flagella basal body P-ring formation protein FlgA [Sphingomonas sp.]
MAVAHLLSTLVMGLAPVPGCFIAAHDVAEGETLSGEALVPAACRKAEGRAPVRYDRGSAAAVATRALRQGDYLGRVALPVEGGVRKGEALTLRSSAGPVTIERQVVALQAGRPGGRLFVRDGSGQVFAVRYVVEGRQ